MDIAQAYVQIIPSAEGIGSGIEDIIAPEAEESGKKAGEKAGGGLVDTIKKVMAAAAVGETIKKSLDAGGAIQQSFGGLDTLYGDASGMAKEFAVQAAAAGISANSYAEQAVSFGAALSKSLGGDSVAAAKAANTAIMDMTDNAAKMGSDIQSIQNAYQGFAKGNFTMLDNLKLGYGGTKEEMERLLKDASKLPEAMGKTFDINNTADIYEAIHLIQGDLGLTGVAAEEASSTFSGSFGAMQASLENFLAAMSADELDVGPALDALVSSAGTFVFGNLLPMLWNIASQIPHVISEALWLYIPDMMERGVGLIEGLIEGFKGGFPAIDSGVIELLQTIAANLIEDSIWLATTGMELVTVLANGFMEGVPEMVGQAGELILFVLDELIEYAPLLINAGISMIQSIGQGILQNGPAIITSVAGVIAQIAATIGQNLPQFLQAGFQLLGTLISGIISAIPQIPSAVMQIINSIRQGFTGIDWGSIGSQIISGIAAGISGAAGKIAEAAKNAAKSAFEAAKSFLGIHSPSRLFRDEVGQYIGLGLAEGIEDSSRYVSDAMTKLSDASVGMINTDVKVAQEESEDPALQLLGRIANILERGQTIEINGREFGRAVRAYA